MKENLNADIDVLDVWKAHRAGPRKGDRARVIITKLAYHSKEIVMENISKLKDKLNSHRQKIFVNEQIPEGVQEESSIKIKNFNQNI